MFRKIDWIIRDTQARVLLKGMKSPLFVTAMKAELLAVEIKVDGSVIASTFSHIQNFYLEINQL